MFYLGQVIEFNEDKGYGLLLDQNSAQTIKFYFDDFPRQGGKPKKGETVKYVVVSDKNGVKAHQMIRLDVAMSNELKNLKVDIAKQKNILKRGKNDGGKFGLISAVMLVMCGGLLYFAFAAWNQYQTYQDEQKVKFALLEIQQKQAIEQQRKDVGHVRSVHFSDKSKDALNEKMDTELVKDVETKSSP